MPAETASPIVPATVQPPDLLQEDRSIQRRIDRTRFQVKLVELATASTLLMAGILVFLLLVTLIDHWAVGLTLGMRLTALILLLVGSAAFCIWRLVPALTRPVNPVYAARAIEQAVPTLKNSLINFLLLRTRRDLLRPVIYAGVQRQAAADLTSIDVDSAVDRSELIRVGYLLTAAVVLLGVYKVTSPKDPFQSVARVIMPWKPIPRPSRVQIRQVRPGPAEVYRGEVLEVTALVDGLKDDEAVRLCYSTEDRQAVNREILLQRSENDPRFRGALTTGEFGIQDPLVYYLRAGDARTDDYRVLLKEAPSISLQSVEYRYPQYTGWADEKVTGQGDLKALEGTQVRLEALANQPIRSVYLELFTPDDLVPGDAAPTPSQVVPIKSEGPGWGEIHLLLQADRRSPQFGAYRIRFLNQQGQRNTEPAQYGIQVTPDLPPLVEIVSPRRRDLELPEDGSLPIEVRALDPDFALRRMTLQAVKGNTQLVQQVLLDELRQGQVLQQYEFVPRQLGLSAGDVVLYWATAEDNRTATGSPKADPNQQRTEDYRIRIVAAETTPADDPKGEPQDTPTQDRQDLPQPADEAGDAEQTSDDGAQGSSEGQAGQDDSAAASPAGEAADSEGAGESGAQAGEASGAGEDPSAGSEDRPGNAASESSPGADRGEPNGQPSDAPTGEPDEPVASDGSNDSDAFERILEHLREQRPEATTGAEDATPASEANPSESPRPEPAAPESGSPTTEATEPPESASGAASDQPPGTNSGATGEGTRNASDSRQPSQAEVGDSSDRPQATDPQGQPPPGESPSTDAASPDTSSAADRAAHQQGDTSQPQQGSDQPGPQADRAPAGGEGSQPPQPGAAEGADGRPGQRPEQSEGSEPPSQGPTPDSALQGQPSGDGGTDGSGASPAETADGMPTGTPDQPGGQPATGEVASEVPADGESQADQANLQFAREATDLALEHLRDQQDNQQLLQRLGWTPEQAAAFLQRWQQMQGAAREQGMAGQQARRRFDDQLRGLGLRPNDAAVRRNIAAADGLRGLTEEGGRSAPPAEYRDQYRAFLRSFSRQQDE